MQSFNNFADAAKAMGVNVKPSKKPKKEKVVKCRICGTVMERVPNTNILVCKGEVEKDGVKEPCRNFTYTSLD